MATHSSILAWKIPMDRSLAGYSPWGCKVTDRTEQLSTSLHPEEVEHLFPFLKNMLHTSFQRGQHGKEGK